VFLASWVVVAALYWPAAQAGFVADFTGWLHQTLQYGFLDNINRTHYHGKSLYQLTQLVTWLYYWVAGTNHWLWHLLFLSLHAFNATLLFVLVRAILLQAGAARPSVVAAAAALWFSCIPSLAEVIVWEPSFHFLQGLALTLGVLRLSQRYLQSGLVRYAVLAVLVFALSTFSLEVFYLTPWLVLALIGFHSRYSPLQVRSALHYLVLPMLLLFAAHLLLFHAVYGEWVAHIGTQPFSAPENSTFSKPWKLLFHLLLLGRFWPDAIRQAIYHAADQWWLSAGLYALTFGWLFWAVSRFGRLAPTLQAAALLFGCAMANLLLLQPLWFPTDGLVVYDRYTYSAAAFLFPAITILLGSIRLRWLLLIASTILLLVNVRCTIRVSRYWMKSANVINNLLRTFPADTKKKVILLNLPQNMHGLPMIGAEQESEFKMMYNGLHHQSPINTVVHDALAYNMLTPQDGAHVVVRNDSTVQVTLNQWGTWWWYAMRGASSYQNADYKLDVVDAGHWYQLTLRHPAADYLLLYQQGADWRVVDFTKRDVEQY
jgi:hypothetical protein